MIEDSMRSTLLGLLLLIGSASATTLVSAPAYGRGTPDGCCVCTQCGPANGGACIDNGQGLFLGCSFGCSNIGCRSGTRIAQACANLPECIHEAPLLSRPLIMNLILLLCGLGVIQVLRQARTDIVKLGAIVAVTLSAVAAIYATSQMHGGGVWRSDLQSTPANAAQLPTQHWTIDATRGADDSLHGRIDVTGSPLMSSGRVDGQITGDAVSGSVADDAGRPIASITGTVASGAINGQYRTPDGETGWFSWGAP